MRQAHDVAAAAADDASAHVIVFAADAAVEATTAANAPPAGKQTCTNGRVHTIIGQEN